MHHATNSNMCRGATHDHLRLASKLTWGSVKNPQSPTRALNRRLTAQENGQGHFLRGRASTKRAHCKLQQCESASGMPHSRDARPKWRRTARMRIQRVRCRTRKEPSTTYGQANSTSYAPAPVSSTYTLNLTSMPSAIFTCIDITQAKVEDALTVSIASPVIDIPKYSQHKMRPNAGACQGAAAGDT